MSVYWSPLSRSGVDDTLSEAWGMFTLTAQITSIEGTGVSIPFRNATIRKTATTAPIFKPASKQASNQTVLFRCFSFLSQAGIKTPQRNPNQPATAKP